MKIDFSGKSVLVTGASGGIGSRTAIAFSSLGARVYLHYNANRSAVESTEEEIKKAGGRSVITGFDVSDPKACKDAVEKISEECGGPDILVNNAGISNDALLLRLRDEDWDKSLSVNLSGVMYMIRAAIRPMMKKRCGAIINLVSTVAQTGNPGQAAYSAAKGGVISLTRTLAREFASRNIRVNAVSPGFINTGMTLSLPENTKSKMIEMIPLGRPGYAVEVADTIVFLASDNAGYITGQVLEVNGGLHM